MAVVGIASESNSALSVGFAVSGTLISVEQTVVTNASGALITVDQTIGKAASGSLITVEQEIIERIAASGSLISVEQSIVLSASGSLITVEQRVKDSVAPSNESLHGWDLLVQINGATVSNSELYGTMNIVRREGQAALLDITLIKQPGVQDLYAYHGKSITVDLIEVAQTRRIYTGIIDIPEVDLINGLITLRCTDKRKEQINSQFAGRVATVGKWSDHIFDTPVDTADELTQRLKTTTTVVDFDAYGNYTVSDSLPKSTPQITLTDSDVYRRKPSLKVASRARLTNRVNLEFTYQYTRLRHRELNFKLQAPTFCQIITSGGVYKFLRVEAIPSTIDSTSYKLKTGSLSITYMPSSGVYNCRNPYTGQYSDYYWSTASTQYATQPKLDSSGNQVYDAQGNPVYEAVRTSVTDYAKAFGLDATWVGAKDFVQNIQEKINIQVNAPQSQLRFGVVEKDQKNGHRVEYDAGEFEKNEKYIAPNNMAQVGTDWYRDEAGDSRDYLNALDTALSMAQATIKQSHRSNIVSFETPPRSDIDLKHTLRVNAGLIDATGKVVEVSHSFNMSTRAASSSFDIAFSQSDNSPPSDTLNVSLLGIPLVGNGPTSTITIYTDEAAKPTAGSFGIPKVTTANSTFNVPAIDDASRNEQLVETSYTYDIPINNDNLTVTFQ